MTAQSFQCPSCGAPLLPRGSTVVMSCPHCHTAVIVPEELRQDLEAAQWATLLFDNFASNDKCPNAFAHGGIHLVVADPDMQEILAETVSLEDGSYRVSVASGTYHVCLKWETGMTGSGTITVSENAYVVEDFEVGQG